MNAAQAVIVGPGRIGSFLKASIPGSKLVCRGESIPDLGPGPIFLCVRNDDLTPIIEHTPKHRHADLVFMQNGMYLPVLEKYGLERATQAVLYFAIPQRGATPEDGGLTQVTGRWAQCFRQALESQGIQCKITDLPGIRRLSAEKWLWISIFSLLGAIHGCNVGDVATKHERDARALFEELRPIAEGALEVHLDPDVWQRMLAYSMSVYAYPGAVREYPWRNGSFLTRKFTPIHGHLLTQLGIVGKSPC